MRRSGTCRDSHGSGRGRDQRGRVLPVSTAILFIPRLPEDTNEVRRCSTRSGLVFVGHRHSGTGAPRAVGVVRQLAALCSDVAPTCMPSQARAASSEVLGDLQAIDLAIWDGRHPRPPHDPVLPRARCDARLTVAAALGDLERVRQTLDANPARIRETRPSGRRPLSAAVEAGHDAIARLLLERGVDPNWGEPGAPKGRSLQVAAGAGKRELVELLLAHGADPSSTVDSSPIGFRGGQPGFAGFSWLAAERRPTTRLVVTIRSRARGERSTSRRVSALSRGRREGKKGSAPTPFTAGLRVPSVLPLSDLPPTHATAPDVVAHDARLDELATQTLLHHIVATPVSDGFCRGRRRCPESRHPLAAADISRGTRNTARRRRGAARTNAVEMWVFSRRGPRRPFRR